jgi:Cdc6-like AAA superfamily ATPase
MIYTRSDHTQFLEEELKAVTDEFRKKLDTQAAFLLQEKGEMFVAQFITFTGAGEMILKFPNTRSLPRKGDYLYCFTVPKKLRDYRNWGNMTYGDLLKLHNNHSEGIVCIWHVPDKRDKNFSIVAFRGVDTCFAHNIAPQQFADEETENKNLPADVSADAIVRKDGIILLLGPNKPPFEYLANLQKIVQNNNIESVNCILDNDFALQNNIPEFLDSKRDISGFVISQLELSDTFILQGPPGTGKTHLIAQICEKLCKQRKSVLVTALTNRALIEVAEKPALEQILKERKIYKTKLSKDEQKEIKNLQQLEDIVPMPGQLVLSTFYFTSKTAVEAIISEQNFDYVIVDEASQAFLSTLAMSKILSRKTIWVGDCKQLAPIILLNEDRINARKWDLLSDGFLAMTSYKTCPLYQLTDSYRLTGRAANYTGVFYQDTLKSKTDAGRQFIYPEMPPEISQLFNPKGGPTLLKTDLPIGEKKPLQAIKLTTKIIVALMQKNPQLEIAVLTKQIATVKFLQKAIPGNHKNLCVETVDRVQGLTTDVTIFVIPNTGLHFSLEPRLFNVATSRAKRHTIIIADKGIVEHPRADNGVKTYLQKLDNDFSFYIQGDSSIGIVQFVAYSLESLQRS